MSRRIYFGGDILTLEGEGRADYLVAENGKIKGAGKGTPPVLSADTEKIAEHFCPPLSIRTATFPPAPQNFYSSISKTVKQTKKSKRRSRNLSQKIKRPAANGSLRAATITRG